MIPIFFFHFLRPALVHIIPTFSVIFEFSCALGENVKLYVLTRPRGLISQIWGQKVRIVNLLSALMPSITICVDFLFNKLYNYWLPSLKLGISSFIIIVNIEGAIIAILS